MKNSLQKLFLVFTFAAIGIISEAQNNLGHNTDNYSGVYALTYNPAEIVESRFKFHMNIY